MRTFPKTIQKYRFVTNRFTLLVVYSTAIYCVFEGLVLFFLSKKESSIKYGSSPIYWIFLNLSNEGQRGKKIENQMYDVSLESSIYLDKYSLNVTSNS